MLIAVSAMHGRHALSRIWAKHTASLGFDRVCVCVTEDTDMENVDMCLDHGFLCTGMPNDPLAGKFNRALKQALSQGATRIMILPSDDFVSPAWVEAARNTEHDYISAHTCAIVCPSPQKAYTIRKNSFTGTLKFGAGRVISRAVIDKLGGELWPSQLNRGLDTASHRRIEAAGFKVQVVETPGIPIADVKTPDNLWPYQTWEPGSQPATFDEALHMVTPELRAEIAAL